MNIFNQKVFDIDFILCLIACQINFKLTCYPHRCPPLIFCDSYITNIQCPLLLISFLLTNLFQLPFSSLLPHPSPPDPELTPSVSVTASDILFVTSAIFLSFPFFLSTDPAPPESSTVPLVAFNTHATSTAVFSITPNFPPASTNFPSFPSISLTTSPTSVVAIFTSTPSI